MRRSVLSSLPSRTRHSLMCVHEICEKNSMWLWKSVAISLSINVIIAIECLGVRVATIVVKMMKKKCANGVCGHLSQLVQFNIAQFVNCTTRLFAERDGFSCLLEIFND